MQSLRPDRSRRGRLLPAALMLLAITGIAAVA
jgi:hypothetical protein